MEEVPLPKGISTPSEVMTACFGSGVVDPTPFVLCFPGGSFSI